MISKNKSLRKQLVINLLGVFTAFYVVTATILFVYSYREAQEFQDDTLKQIARYSGDTSFFPQSPGATKPTESDSESAVFVFHLPHDQLPEWLNKPLALGFQDYPTPMGKMRVFVNDDDQGRDIVAQLTEERDEIAVNSALRSLLPLLFLLPLVAFLITRVVSVEFKKINQRAEELDRQTSSNLQTISDHDLPIEMIPFFSAINRLIERIKSLIAFKRRFIADASHELRTPITALSLQVDNLSAIEDMVEVKKRLTLLKNMVTRTRELADQLLIYSKYEVYRPQFEKINIAAVLNQVLSGLVSIADAKKVSFDVRIDEHVSQIETDPQIMKTLFRNLLHNAIKFSPETSTVIIKINELDSQQLQIEVNDFGPGIPSEHRQLVFEPFKRLVGSEVEGSGLGLAITKECLSLLRGQIELTGHESGQSGLCVRLSIPLQRHLQI